MIIKKIRIPKIPRKTITDDSSIPYSFVIKSSDNIISFLKLNF